jgi:hypothetical protein
MNKPLTAADTKSIRRKISRTITKAGLKRFMLTKAQSHALYLEQQAVRARVESRGIRLSTSQSKSTDGQAVSLNKTTNNTRTAIMS